MPPSKSKSKSLSRIEGIRILHRNYNTILDYYYKLDEVINEILSGKPSNGLHVEKLSGFEQLYSCRLSIVIRLLFCYININGKTFLLLVDVLDNHDYSCLIKNRSNLQNIKDRVLAGLDIVDHYYEAEETPCPADKKEVLYPFNNRFITLSEQQHSALGSKLPLLIDGSAGSGKTITAKAILADAVMRYKKENAEKKDTDFVKKRRFAYVTRSQNLADHERDDWKKLDYLEDASIDVQFFTYEQFAQYLTKNTAASVDEKNVAQWYAQEIKKMGKQSWANAMADVLKEFRLLCMYEEEEYLAVGRNNTAFSTLADRQMIYQLFTSYRKRFPDDIQFTLLEKKVLFDLVILDESQDLSMTQIQSVLRVSKDWVLCIDMNQNLTGKLSLHPHLQKLFEKEELKNVSEVYFEKSFRNSKAVAGLANRFLKIKWHLNDGSEDKRKQLRVIVDDAAEEGFVALSNSTQQTLELCRKYKDSEIVVICHEEFKDEANRLFPGICVLTPAEIKGRERRIIIAYRLFDSKKLYSAHAQLAVETLNDKVHRSKDQKAKDYLIELNAVYTAFTRATEGVIVQQASTHNTQHWLRHLELAVQKKHTIDPSIIKPETTDSEWEKVINELLAEGNIKSAMRVWTRIMKRDARTFPAKQNTASSAMMGESSGSSSARPVPASSSQMTEKTPFVSRRKMKEQARLADARAKKAPVSAKKSEAPNPKINAMKLVHKFLGDFVGYMDNFSKEIVYQGKSAQYMLIEDFSSKTPAEIKALFAEAMQTFSTTSNTTNKQLPAKNTLDMLTCCKKALISLRDATIILKNYENYTDAQVNEYCARILIDNMFSRRRPAMAAAISFVFGAAVFSLPEKAKEHEALVRALRMPNVIYLQYMVESGAELIYDLRRPEAHLIGALILQQIEHVKYILNRYPSDAFKNLEAKNEQSILYLIRPEMEAELTPILTAKGMDFSNKYSNSMNRFLYECITNSNPKTISDALETCQSECKKGTLVLEGSCGAKALYYVLTGIQLQRTSHPGYLNDQIEIIKLLIKNGASINSVNEHGDSLLMVAAAFSHESIIAALIGNGIRYGQQINFHYQNPNTNKTVFCVAQARGDAQITLMLSSYKNAAKAASSQQGFGLFTEPNKASSSNAAESENSYTV